MRIYVPLHHLLNLTHDSFFCFGRGRIGCAYYDPVKYLIYVLEDTLETAHFDVTKTRQSPLRYIWVLSF